MPLREAALVVTLLNHPRLAEEHFDEIEGLDLRHPGLKALHAALLDAVAHHAADDPARLADVIDRAGATASSDAAEALVRKARLWPALADAAIDDAREAFFQALRLHRQARALDRELKAAEAALARETTEENFRRLVDIRAELHEAQAMEALIDGFGGASGRGRGM